MIIDGHAHAAGVFFEKETLIAELDRLGVDKIVLAPMGVKNDPKFSATNMENSFSDGNPLNWIKKIYEFIEHFSDIIYDKPNEYLFSLKQQCPDRIIQYYWANPNNTNIMQELETHLPLWKFSGVKLHQMVANFDTNQPSMHHIADFCKIHDMPLFIHLFKPKHVSQFCDLVKQHPQTKFIVAHMIGYDKITANCFGLDNFWFDISPSYFVTEKQILKAFKKYGSGRLMLGSDTPLGGNNLLEKNIHRIKTMGGLDDVDREKILGNNLKALLKI